MACLVLLVLGIVLALAQNGLEKLLNSSGEDAYQSERRDLYNEYGLTDNKSLSTAKLLETDSLVVYRDRLFKINQTDKSNATYAANIAKALTKQTGADLLIMPVPQRGIFEDGYESEKDQYSDYIAALEKALGAQSNRSANQGAGQDANGVATVLNPLSALQKHSDEYIFYRTESCWTMRGAFYGSQLIFDTLGYDKQDLDSYSEYVFGDFIGNLKSEAASQYASEKVGTKISDIENDPFYIYIKESNPNREALTYEQKSDDDSDDSDDEEVFKTVKRPTILLNDGGPSSIIANNYEHSVVEGSGDENVLLITDKNGKMMISYLSEVFGKVYVSNVQQDDHLVENLDSIIDDYNIKHIIWVQDVSQMGNKSYMRALNSLVSSSDKSDKSSSKSSDTSDTSNNKKTNEEGDAE